MKVEYIENDNGTRYMNACFVKHESENSKQFMTV
jgi:hypothetical protein